MTWWKPICTFETVATESLAIEQPKRTWSVLNLWWKNLNVDLLQKVWLKYFIRENFLLFFSFFVLLKSCGLRTTIYTSCIWHVIVLEICIWASETRRGAVMSKDNIYCSTIYQAFKNKIKQNPLLFIKDAALWGTLWLMKKRITTQVQLQNVLGNTNTLASKILMCAELTWMFPLSG